MSGRLSDATIASWAGDHRFADVQSMALELRDHRATIAAAHAEFDALGAPRVREVTGESIGEAEIMVVAGGTDALARRAAISAADPKTPRLARARALAACAAAYNALPESDRLLTLAERIQWLAARGGGR